MPILQLIPFVVEMWIYVVEMRSEKRMNMPFFFPPKAHNPNQANLTQFNSLNPSLRLAAIVTVYIRSRNCSHAPFFLCTMMYMYHMHIESVHRVLPSMVLLGKGSCRLMWLVLETATVCALSNRAKWYQNITHIQASSPPISLIFPRILILRHHVN